MSKTINITLDTASLTQAVNEVRAYKAWVERKTAELVKVLAEFGKYGVEAAYWIAEYDGDKFIDITVEQRDEYTYAIVAGGKTMLILEFGAGVRRGGGHPLAGSMGYGPGTYPGQTHAIDPGYWYYSDSTGGHKSSEGNPPSMAMYNETKDLRDNLEMLARGVFGS